MRILLLSSVDYPNGDASSAHAALIVRGFRENDVAAALMIPHASRLGNLAENLRIRGHAGGVPFLYTNGRTTRPQGGMDALLDSLRGMLGASRLILRQRKNRKLDAVILGTPDSLEFFPVILTCILFRIPMYVWTVELMSTLETGTDSRMKLRRAGHLLTETLLPRLSSGYIVISSALFEYYRKRLPARRLLVVPIMVDPSSGPEFPDASHTGNQTAKTILYGGTFAEKDGVDYLLKAFKLLHDRYPEARFVLTGKSPNASVMGKLYALTDELGVKDAVEFRGFVSRSELARIQREADVFLVCRTRSRFAGYGFPWKLGEYCMSEKPIVATRVGDIDLYFKDSKHLFLAEPENVESIAAKLNQVFSDYGSAKLVAARCREAARSQLHYKFQMNRVRTFLQGNSRNRGS